MSEKKGILAVTRYLILTSNWLIRRCGLVTFFVHNAIYIHIARIVICHQTVAAGFLKYRGITRRTWQNNYFPVRLQLEARLQEFGLKETGW